MNNITEDMIKKHQNVLKECFFTPFKISRIPTQQPNIPIFFSLLECKIDRENSDKLKYKLKLKYGMHSWTVSRHILDLGKFLNLLRQSKFEFLKMGGISNILGPGFFDRLEKIFNNCIFEMITKVHIDVNKIFCISRYSFVGTKIYEECFNVNVSPLDETNYFLYFFEKSPSLTKMYIIIKQECIIFCENTNEQRILFVFMFDGNTKIQIKNDIIGREISIKDLKKKIKIKSKHTKRMNDLYSHIVDVYNSSKHKSINRYDSFAPQRKNVPIEFMVEGRSYFSSVYKAFKSAEKTIFIAGWWVFPKVYLKRVMENGKPLKKYRLDNVLKTKAKDGVKIYILLYREFELALPNNSAYSEKAFLALHKNIQVIRHPTFIDEGLIYWSHHEKIVIIDNKVAFLGGIDLCLGRFDTSAHHLFDDIKIKSERQAFEKYKEGKIRDKKNLLNQDEDIEYWPGNDFSNPLIKDFEHIGVEDDALIDRSSVPRLSWHDIHCKVSEYGALDVARHFIERWNYTVFQTQNPSYDYLLVKDEDKISTGENFKYKGDIQMLRSIGQWSNRYVTERSIAYAYEDIIMNAQRHIYIENQFFITSFKEKSESENPCNILGKFILERIIKAYKNKEDFKVYILIPLLPAFEAELNSPNSSIQEIIKIQSESIIKSENSLFKQLQTNGIEPSDYVLILSLRKGVLKENRVASELIYIHAKIIIADSERGIIGSANFNDRSMMGDRDSEMAVMIENSPEFFKDFQKKLLLEHLGFKSKKPFSEFSSDSEKDLNNFLTKLFENDGWMNLEKNEVFKAIKLRAKINTNLFRQLYRVIPDNEIRSKSDFKSYSSKPALVNSVKDIDELKKIFNRIRGHLVIFPVYFFIEETPESGIFSVSGLIPSVIYY